MKKYEVWLKGVSKQLKFPWSQYIGIISGLTFEEAFKNYMNGFDVLMVKDRAGKETPMTVYRDWPMWAFNAENETLCGEKIYYYEI